MTHRHVTYLRRAEYDVTCDRSIPNWGTHRQHIQYIQGREGGPTKTAEREGEDTSTAATQRKRDERQRRRCVEVAITEVITPRGRSLHQSGLDTVTRSLPHRDMGNSGSHGNSVTEYRPDRSRSPSHICLCSRMLSPLTCLHETRVRS